MDLQLSLCHHRTREWIKKTNGILNTSRVGDRDLELNKKVDMHTRASSARHVRRLTSARERLGARVLGPNLTHPCFHAE